MINSSRAFRFSLLLNVSVLLYSAYQVRVNDSEFWGYTFIGVFLWVIGMYLVAPSRRMPLWYNLNDLLLYPFMFLIAIKVLDLSSGFKSFVVYTTAIFIATEVAIALILRQQPRKIARVATLYYTLLTALAWVIYYKYPLLPLTYSFFVLYCAMSLLQLIDGEITVVHNERPEYQRGNNYGQG